MQIFMYPYLEIFKAFPMKTNAKTWSVLYNCGAIIIACDGELFLKIKCADDDEWGTRAIQNGNAKNKVDDFKLFFLVV